MVGLLAAFAILWLIIFSAVSYRLVYGHEKERFRYEELVKPCLILAWVNVLGFLLIWVVTSLFFRG